MLLDCPSGLNMDVRVWLLLVPVLLPALAVAELYQWQDEQGRTHFSERPPAPAESAPESVRRLEEPGGNRFRPRYQGSRLVCGRQPVPQHSGDAESYVLFLARYLTSGDDVGATGLAAQEQRCLQAWARSELRRYADVEAALLDEHERLVGRLHALALDRDSKCPSAASGWLVGEAARQWADCHLPLESTMETLRGRLKALHPLVSLRESAGRDEGR